MTWREREERRSSEYFLLEKKEKRENLNLKLKSNSGQNFENGPEHAGAIQGEQLPLTQPWSPSGVIWYFRGPTIREENRGKLEEGISVHLYDWRVYLTYGRTIKCCSLWGRERTLKCLR